MFNALREYIPVFLSFQLLYTLVTALLYLLISKLSDFTGGDGQVIESLSSRVLGAAFETSSISGFLYGDSSILSSLTASSLYVTMLDGVIDIYRRPKEEKKKSFREQWAGMLKDPSVFCVVILLLLSILSTAISQVAFLGDLAKKILLFLITVVWIYNGIQFVLKTHFIRYGLITVSILFIDQLGSLAFLMDLKLSTFIIWLLVRMILFVITGIFVASALRCLAWIRDACHDTAGDMDFSLEDVASTTVKQDP